MKKVILVVLLFMTVFTLTACNDQTFENDTVTVIFFTANFGAEDIESYFDVEPNTKIEEPEEPVRQGFTFTGWYQNIDITNPWDFDTDTVGEDSIVLYAGWDPMTFDIIYDANGGTIIGSNYPTEFETGEGGVLPVATLPGYQFVAWYTYDWEDESDTIPGDSGYQSLPTEQYEDLYLYAHYEAVDVEVTFRTNFPVDDAGPDNPSKRRIEYGDEINFPILEDTDGYEFIGWNESKTGDGDFYNNGDIFERTLRITLYGVWQLIE